jgi:hypothetical protein
MDRRGCLTEYKSDQVRGPQTVPLMVWLVAQGGDGRVPSAGKVRVSGCSAGVVGGTGPDHQEPPPHARTSPVAG